jgi:hypothetical protein
MSITKSTVEISNSESEKEDYEKNSLYIKTTEWINTYFYSLSNELDMNNVMYYSFIILWILFTSLSIKESLKCDNKVIYIILSLIPFVNFILYFSIYNNLICVTRYNTENVSRNLNRNGVGFLNSMLIYPSKIFEGKENKPKNNTNTYPNTYPKNNTNTYPKNNTNTYPKNKPTNYPKNKPTNNPKNNPTNYPKNNPTNYPTNYPKNNPTNYPKNNNLKIYPTNKYKT